MGTERLRAIARGRDSGLAQFVIPIKNPVAGAEWSITVPGQETWQLVAVTFTLVTSNAPTARFPIVQIMDGTTLIGDVPAFSQVAASSTVRQTGWTKYATGSSNNAATINSFVLPDWVLPAGWAIRSATDALDVGDQYEHVVLTVLRAYTGDIAGVNVAAERIADHWQAINELLTTGRPW